jgi:hypothetical protein
VEKDMRLIRLASACVIGILAAGCIIAAVEAIGHAQMVGDRAFAFAVLGYFLGALGGSAVASWIADARTSAVIPITLAVLALVNLLSFPHPPWFTPMAAFALAGGWLAGVWISKRLPKSLGRSVGS